MALLVYGKEMQNGKSILFQTKPDRPNLTVVDTLLITLNSFELNMIATTKQRDSGFSSQNIQGKDNQSEPHFKCQ